MNWLKRAMGALGFGRRIKSAYYKGAETGRLLWDWIVSPITADQEIRSDVRRLRARARDLAKNSPVIRQYLSLLTANVIGHRGMTLQAQVRNNSGDLSRDMNDRIETAWADWGRDCSVDGRLDFVGFQRLALKTVATDGETFIRKVYGYPNRYGFALQLIDPDLVDHEFNQVRGKNQPEIRLGVEVDDWGRPVAYHTFDRHPSDTGGPRDRIRIPASEVIHLYDPERANQTRGVSWLNSVMVPLRMLDGYIEAELVAARTGAAKMGFLKYTDPSAFEPPDPATPVRIDASPGTIETLQPGLEFQEWSPDHPTAAFPDFVKAVLRQVATGLRVSYNALANDLEGVNYSSMRSGLLIERDMWRVYQEWWMSRFLQPVYEAWLSTALLAGGLKLDSRDPRKFNDVRWQPRGWAWVDPEKDVNASVIAITNGLASRTEVLAEKGLDPEEVFERLSEEKALAEQYGIELTGETAQTKQNGDNAAPPQKKKPRALTAL